jgi:hypothetical protein
MNEMNKPLSLEMKMFFSIAILLENMEGRSLTRDSEGREWKEVPET